MSSRLPDACIPPSYSGGGAKTGCVTFLAGSCPSPNTLYNTTLGEGQRCNLEVCTLTLGFVSTHEYTQVRIGDHVRSD